MPVNRGDQYYVKCLGSDTELFTGTDVSDLYLNNLIVNPRGQQIPSNITPPIPPPPQPYQYVPPNGWVLRPMTIKQFNQFSLDAEKVINLINAGETTLAGSLTLTLINSYQPILWSQVALNLANSYRTGYNELDASFPAMRYDSVYQIHWVYAPPEFNSGYNPIIELQNTPQINLNRPQDYESGGDAGGGGPGE